MLNLGLGLGLARSSSSGGGGFSEFEHDADTMYFDTNSANNTINSTGYNSMAVMPDVINGERSLVQPVKGLQPFVVDDGGEDVIDFNDDTDQSMTFDDISEIAKGHGYYLGMNFKPTTNGNSTFLFVARNASSNASRGLLYYTSSRYVGGKLKDNDASGVSWWGYNGTKLTLGTEYSIEYNVLADGATASPLDIWIDGVEGNPLLAENSDTLTFPDTSPSVIYFGNTHAGGESVDGTIKNIIFQNSNQAKDSTLRVSQGAYLNAQRTA